MVRSSVMFAGAGLGVGRDCGDPRGAVLFLPLSAMVRWSKGNLALVPCDSAFVLAAQSSNMKAGPGKYYSEAR
jgi:hypothetical protein